MLNTTRHVPTSPAWIVWRASPSGVEYWTGEGWTPRRADARDFDNVTSAASVADKHSAALARR